MPRYRVAAVARWRLGLIRVVMAGVGVLGCGSGTDADDLLAERAIRPEWVTPAVAESLDAAGRFVLAPVRTRPGEHDLLALRALGDSLLAWLRLRPEGTADFLEARTGRRIDFAQLGPCRREFLYLSPYTDFDPALPAAFRNGASSRLHQPVCDARGIAAVLALAGTTDVIFPGGLPTTPRFGSGNSFEVNSPGFAALVSPETAATLVRQRTGHRIAAVPVLLGPIYYIAEGYCAAWRVATDSVTAVPLPGGGAPLARRVFYVSARGCVTFAPGALLVEAEPPQPTRDTFSFLLLDSLGGATRDTTLILALAEPRRLWLVP
jgi:hypothetical protein